jgi:glyoxylase-like metal-dependent hydrolase (beta-lactamase superfamily II)
VLEIVTFTLGPAMTNAYLVADSETKEAAVIDPAWDGHAILTEAIKRGWRVAHLWYTHAHFDHIGGAAAIADALNPLPLVALHPADHVLWRAEGGAPFFGFKIDPGPEPTIDLQHGQILKLGSVEFEVRHTPGHTPGHCILYVPSRDAERSDPTGEHSRSVCFCGDLIFRDSYFAAPTLPAGIGRLAEEHPYQVFTLPDETRLLQSRPEKTVSEEKRSIRIWESYSSRRKLQWVCEGV